jgi:hypothetical protein
VSAPCDNCAICDPTNRTTHLPVTIVYTALASTPRIMKLTVTATHATESVSEPGR